MGEAYITRRGGAAKAKAVIGATYPSGSTCICYNDAKTIPAKDTSGSFLFLLPTAGEWTISISDDDHTVPQTKTVEVDENQAVSVAMEYERYLIRDGAATETFSVEQGSLVADSGGLKLAASTSSNTEHSAVASVTVDFDDGKYSELVIDGDGVYTEYGDPNRTYVSVGGTQKKQNMSSTRDVYTMGISDLTEEHTVEIHSHSAFRDDGLPWTTSNTRLYNLYLR